MIVREESEYQTVHSEIRAELRHTSLILSETGVISAMPGLNGVNRQNANLGTGFRHDDAVVRRQIVAQTLVSLEELPINL